MAVNPLCVATQGMLANKRTDAMAVQGMICLLAFKTGGVVRTKQVKVDKPLDQVDFNRLLQEDEELIAIIVAGVQIGII